MYYARMQEKTTADRMLKWRRGDEIGTFCLSEINYLLLKYFCQNQSNEDVSNSTTLCSEKNTDSHFLSYLYE